MMDLKDIQIKELPTPFIMDTLAQGWSPSQLVLVHEFLERLEGKLGTTFKDKKIGGGNTVSFTMQLDNMCLRTMEDIPCIILSGANATDDASRFWEQVSSPHRLPFVIALSEEAYAQARKAIPESLCLISSRTSVKQLMKSSEPLAVLKQLILAQIPRQMLIPFNTLLPATNNMFFGRSSELAKLSREDTTSFAVTGPGRIGKTSLISRHRQGQMGKHDFRARFRFYISFYECRDTSDDAVARFLAMSVSPSSRSDRMESAGIQRFLKYMRSTLGGPLELLLDEVDLVCQGETFKSLGEAARLGICRLILCGKGILFRTMQTSEFPLDSRLDALLLGPLDEEAAHSLLLRPLIDLGFSIQNGAPVIEEVLCLTGRLPHLIQFCGKKLAEFAIDSGKETISAEDIQRLKEDFLTAQYFIKPVKDLDSSVSRFIGLSILQTFNTSGASISLSEVQDMAKRAGIKLSHQQANETCNDLVINNLVTWDKGSYRIVNEGLYFYARQMGYLDSGWEEALEAVRRRKS